MYNIRTHPNATSLPMTLFKETYRVETARLRGWDYTAAGWYFVTICAGNRQPFFGQVENGVVRLSPIGQTACNYWQQIPQHTAGNVELDVFMVMPDHLHGIIVILDVETLQCNVSTTPQCNVSTRNPNDPMSQISPKSGSLGAIVRSYKSAVSRWCSQNGFAEFSWQGRFYDHIIRNEQALHRIRKYIVENPAHWKIEHRNSENVWR